MIQLKECELEYPQITKFKVYKRKKKKYLGEYTRTELLEKFGDEWLDYGHEEGIRHMEIYLY